MSCSPMELARITARQIRLAIPILPGHPMGQKSHFTSTRDGGNGIYIMNEDSSEQKRLIPADLRGADPGLVTRWQIHRVL